MALPRGVAAELAWLERRLGQAADEPARASLAAMGEAAAARALRAIGRRRREEVRSLSGLIGWLAWQHAVETNAQLLGASEVEEEHESAE
ncbi:hypothetical protein ACP4OV_031410 [Aristida adscensionis]